MKNDIIVGLDIGTTKIVAFVGRRAENGKVEILGMGKTESVGVLRGEVKNIEETSKSIKRAVEAAESQSGVEVHEVYVGIAGHHIRSMLHRGSMMRHNAKDLISQEDVKNLIAEQHGIMLSPGEKIIDIIVQDFIVDGDGGYANPVGMQGACLEANFHIITGNVMDIERIYRSVQIAGYEIQKLILEPIASAEAVVDKDDKDAGVCLVDIGGGTTDIAIFHEGVIRHTAVIPLAGNAITEDVREGCGIIRSQAEALKVKFGSCFPSETREDEIIAVPGIRMQAPREISMKRLSGIIHARVQLILEQVLYEIRSSGYENKLIGGIVLAGGGARMGHIVELTSYITGVDTRIGMPQEHLTGSISEELTHPMYATGIGLVLNGIAHSEKMDSTEVKVERDKEQDPPEEEKPDSEAKWNSPKVWKKIKNMIIGAYDTPIE